MLLKLTCGETPLKEAKEHSDLHLLRRVSAFAEWLHSATRLHPTGRCLVSESCPGCRWRCTADSAAPRPKRTHVPRSSQLRPKRAAFHSWFRTLRWVTSFCCHWHHKCLFTRQCSYFEPMKCFQWELKSLTPFQWGRSFSSFILSQNHVSFLQQTQSAQIDFHLLHFLSFPLLHFATEPVEGTHALVRYDSRVGDPGSLSLLSEELYVVHENDLHDTVRHLLLCNAKKLPIKL